jgi:hypothetical protein
LFVIYSSVPEQYQKNTKRRLKEYQKKTRIRQGKRGIIHEVSLGAYNPPF